MARSKQFTWDRLGKQKDTFEPIHLPFPVDENGDGPTNTADAKAWVCWCGTNCLLQEALEVAFDAGVRIGSGAEPQLEDHDCAKIDAHGPHDWDETYVDFDESEQVKRWHCGGVKAHRDTAIGGRHTGLPAAYGQIDVGFLTGGQK